MSPSEIEQNWKFTKNDGYLALKLVNQLRTEVVKVFEAEARKILEEGEALPIVVDCTQLTDITQPWVRALIQLQKGLKDKGKHLRLFNVPPSITEILRAQGVDKALGKSDSLYEALIELKVVERKKMDVHFVNPFLAATIKVLQTQANLVSKPGKIGIKQGDAAFSGDISGVIGLVADGFNGSVVISFPEATFLRIMERMLGEKFEKITQEIQDGAAELTNMIFGQAKITLNEKGYNIKTAIPSVVSGKNHSFQSLARGPSMTIPFETEVGSFFIDLSLSS